MNFKPTHDVLGLKKILKKCLVEKVGARKEAPNSKTHNVSICGTPIGFLITDNHSLFPKHCCLHNTTLSLEDSNQLGTYNIYKNKHSQANITQYYSNLIFFLKNFFLKVTTL